MMVSSNALKAIAALGCIVAGRADLVLFRQSGWLLSERPELQHAVAAGAASGEMTRARRLVA